MSVACRWWQRTYQIDVQVLKAGGGGTGMETGGLCTWRWILDFWQGETLLAPLCNLTF